MQFESFKCECCDKTHYHLSVSTDDCVEVSRQEVVLEFDRESLEKLMENIQRQLLHTPIRT